MANTAPVKVGHPFTGEMHLQDGPRLELGPDGFLNLFIQFNKLKPEEYLYGQNPNVRTSLEFDKLVAAKDPEMGARYGL